MPAVAKNITHIDGINAVSAKRRAYLIPKSVRPRTRKAIEAMVWQGLTRPEAAATVNLSDNGLYRALKNPEALKYYQNECEMLRSGQRHRNLHGAIHIRDHSKSDKSKIDAMRFLEGDYSERDASIKVGINVNVQPGYICDISEHSDKAKQILQLGGTLLEHKEKQ